MQKKCKNYFLASVIFMLVFIVFTILVKYVDVSPIGPNGSEVGFAALNRAVADAIGVNMQWYNITDWLGIAPVAVAFVFAVCGLVEWIARKSIKKVDIEILLLGGFYLAVIAFYIFFEVVVVNFRPVLMNGYLEASYPSSHVMIALTIYSSAAIVVARLAKAKSLKSICTVVFFTLAAVTVVGRVVSGVHWITDIIGGALLSAFLICVYKFSLCLFDFKKTVDSGIE